MTSPAVSVASEAPPAGLSSEEAARRLAVDGPNELPRQGRRTAARILTGQVANPLVLVLVAAAGIARLLGEAAESTVILLIIVVNALFGFVQEYRAERTLRLLRRFVTRTARAVRDGHELDVPAASLVRGDLVHLESGDLVPADIRLDEADGLGLDESSLTGESAPVTRQAGDDARMGTIVVTGYASGVVVETGIRTMLGRTARLMSRKPDETDFQRNLRRLSGLLVRVIIVLTILVFVVNTAMHKGWLESLLFALALAVGITPEVLPAIITIALARGALRMARDQVVVRQLMSVEDLGNIDTLCCDKTGTLTHGAFSLQAWVDPQGMPAAEVLVQGALAACAGRGTPAGPAANPTDRAVWTAPALEAHRDRLARYTILDRDAFDVSRRRARVVVSDGSSQRLLVKGAPESVLDSCSDQQVAGRRRALSAQDRTRLADWIAAREAEGQRVIALAEGPAHGPDVDDRDESGLALVGFLQYADAPKPEARQALRQFEKLRVRIKLISGDSAAVTRRICGEVGLTIPEDRIISGAELAGMTDDQVAAAAERFGVFARVAPDQKHRLVMALRAAGHVVGFLGDGVNDAPALRAADVGIAVDAGTDVAKEAADIVLLQKSLAVIAAGIVEGRKTFANIVKYILNTISANFGNMATVAASSLFLPFIPLLPSQILLNNLLSDLPMVTIATDRVDPGQLRRPRRWAIPAIARFMIWFGLLSACFDLLLIIPLRLLWHVDIAVFRTAWFVESACSEMLVTFAIRTRLPLFRSRPSAVLTWSSLLAGVAAFVVPWTPLGQSSFGFVPLPPAIMLFVIAVLGTYLLAAELAKRRAFRTLAL